MSETPRHTCQYIAGEKGRDFAVYDASVYCGAPCRRIGDGWSSYCEEHHKACHTRWRRRRRPGAGSIRFSHTEALARARAANGVRARKKREAP